MNRTIEEKKAFVAKMSELVREVDGDIESVEYKCMPDKYMEVARIRYTTMDRYINVTGDSLRTILIDVARELNGQNAIGAVTDPRHAQLIETWWRADE